MLALCILEHLHSPSLRFCSKRARIERVASRALADMELCAPLIHPPLFIHTSYAAFTETRLTTCSNACGPNFYGMPFARRSDDEVLATKMNRHHWISYPLPRPKGLQLRRGRTAKPGALAIRMLTCTCVLHLMFRMTFTLCIHCCLLYTSPSPRDRQKSRMPSSA